MLEHRAPDLKQSRKCKLHHDEAQMPDLTKKSMVDFHRESVRSQYFRDEVFDKNARVPFDIECRVCKERNGVVAVVFGTGLDI